MPANWKSAWVTGASSGIGLNVAKRLSQEDISVAVSARSDGKLAQIAQDHQQIWPYPLDVTDPVAVIKTVAEIEKTRGPIELAVLNAGTYEPIDAVDLDGRKWRHTMDVNFMGVVNCLDALLPRMLQRKSGHIAIVGSVAGYRGLPKAASYGPSKAALINLAESMKLELEREGIKLQIINPGFVDTPLVAKNKFPMPFIMPPEKAADIIIKGLKTDKFEIAFPAFFAWMLRASRRIPYPLFFWIIRTFVLPGHNRMKD